MLVQHEMDFSCAIQVSTKALNCTCVCVCVCVCLCVCSSENGVEDEEDLYDCVYDDEEGGDIYEDLMKTDVIPAPVCLPLILFFIS